MANLTERERKALKEAGWEKNPYEHRWMSPEDWQNWNDNQKLEGDINYFLKWAYMLFLQECSYACLRVA